MEIKLNGSGKFWISLLVSGMAGLLLMFMAHSSEPLPHSESASESDVVKLEIKVATIDNELMNVSKTLTAVKLDVTSMRQEQRHATEQILRAIESQEGE